MGTSRNPQQMVGKIKALGTATERNTRKAVAEGALAAKTIMVASAAAKGLTPGSKLAGRRWTGVRFNVTGTRNPEALVRYMGPFHLFDNPTKPHEITAKRAPGATRRGRGGKQALNIGGNIRASATHPGTSGARSFPAAKVIAHRRVPRVMASTISHGWSQTLR